MNGMCEMGERMFLRYDILCGSMGKILTISAPIEYAETISVGVNAPGIDTIFSAFVSLIISPSVLGATINLAPASFAGLTNSFFTTVPAPKSASGHVFFIISNALFVFSTVSSSEGLKVISKILAPPS